MRLICGQPLFNGQPGNDAQHPLLSLETYRVLSLDAQVAVEPEFQLIVGQKVTEAANDKQQMKPLVEVIEEQNPGRNRRKW